MPDRLFCYGTLQSPEVVTAVIGRVPVSQPAVLHGFARYAVTGESYPAVRPKKNSQTRGLLYTGLTPAELRKLDRFEGVEYRRQSHPVAAGGVPRIPAYVYVWSPGLVFRLGRLMP